MFKIVTSSGGHLYQVTQSGKTATELEEMRKEFARVLYFAGETEVANV